MYSQAQIIELLINAIPYANQIKDIDLSSEAKSVQFTWRGNSFRVTETLQVYEVSDGFLSRQDLAILFRQCLNQAMILKEL